MERFNGPKVLLLEDFKTEGPKVEAVINTLEDLNIVRSKRKERNALSFFSDQVEPPIAIIMYMNGQEALGIYFSDNAYMLSSELYGVKRLKKKMACKLKIVGDGQIYLTDFLCSLKPADHIKLFMAN